MITLLVLPQKVFETLVDIVQKVICTYGVVDLKFYEIGVNERKQKHKLSLSLKYIGLPKKEIDLN